GGCVQLSTGRIVWLRFLRRCGSNFGNWGHWRSALGWWRGRSSERLLRAGTIRLARATAPHLERCFGGHHQDSLAAQFGHGGGFLRLGSLREQSTRFPQQPAGVGTRRVQLPAEQERPVGGGIWISDLPLSERAAGKLELQPGER